MSGKQETEVQKSTVASAEKARNAAQVAIQANAAKNLTAMSYDQTVTQLQRLAPHIERAVAGHVKPEVIVQTATTLIRSNPAIAECEFSTIVGGIIQASLVNLSLAPALGQAYLVPFGKNAGTYQDPRWEKHAQFQIGYRGWRQLALRAGLILYGDGIYSNDTFEMRSGSERYIHHVQNWENRGELKGAYALLKFPNGEQVFKVLNKAEIEKLRERNSSQKGKPAKDAWETDYEAMAIAKAVKQLKSYIPTEELFMQDAIATDDKTIDVRHIHAGRTNIAALPAYEAEDDMPETIGTPLNEGTLFNDDKKSPKQGDGASRSGGVPDAMME